MSERDREREREREREGDDNFTFPVGNACINRRAVNGIDKERVETDIHAQNR